MMAAGWPEEVEALARQVPVDAPAWNASGYRAIRAMVEGRLTHQAAMETVIIETRQYAKRQRTWFRHQLAGEDVTRIVPGPGTFVADVERWWAGGSA
jgi:tRNA dimethylallyltransferase